MGFFNSGYIPTFRHVLDSVQNRICRYSKTNMNTWTQLVSLTPRPTYPGTSLSLNQRYKSTKTQWQKPDTNIQIPENPYIVWPIYTIAGQLLKTDIHSRSCWALKTYTVQSETDLFDGGCVSFFFLFFSMYLTWWTYIARGDDLCPDIGLVKSVKNQYQERMILPFDHVDGSARTREQGRHCEESIATRTSHLVHNGKQGMRWEGVYGHSLRSTAP